MHKISVEENSDFRVWADVPRVQCSAAAALSEIRSDPPENTEDEMKFAEKDKLQRTRREVWKNAQRVLQASSGIPLYLKRWRRQSPTHRLELSCPGLSLALAPSLSRDLIDSLSTCSLSRRLQVTSEISTSRRREARVWRWRSHHFLECLSSAHLWFYFQLLYKSRQTTKTIFVHVQIWRRKRMHFTCKHLFVTFFVAKRFKKNHKIHFILGAFQNFQDHRVTVHVIKKIQD